MYFDISVLELYKDIYVTILKVSRYYMDSVCSLLWFYFKNYST
jgi:hypothetical protein